MPLTDSFDRFKTELGQKVQVAKTTGMSDRTIANHAQEVGDYLAKHYDPQSPEERLLKELWDVSDQRQQQAIAEALVHLVQK